MVFISLLKSNIFYFHYSKKNLILSFASITYLPMHLFLSSSLKSSVLFSLKIDARTVFTYTTWWFWFLMVHSFYIFSQSWFLRVPCVEKFFKHRINWKKDQLGHRVYLKTSPRIHSSSISRPQHFRGAYRGSERFVRQKSEAYSLRLAL